MSLSVYREISARYPTSCIIPWKLSDSNPLVRAVNQSGGRLIRVRKRDLGSLDLLREHEVGLIGSFPWILPGEVLHLPRFGILNLHPSLLPRHRGNAPLVWTYLEDDRVCGVTLHIATNELDSGAVLARGMLDLPRGQPYMITYQALSVAGARLAVSVLEELPSSLMASESCPPQEIQPVPARGELPIAWGEWPAERLWHVLSALAQIRTDLIPGRLGRRIRRVAIPRPNVSGVTAGTFAYRGNRCDIYASDGVVTVRMESSLDRILRRIERRLAR